MITSVVHRIGQTRGIIGVGSFWNTRREVEGGDKADEVVQVVIEADSQLVVLFHHEVSLTCPLLLSGSV
jgi:hypothetical protein